MNIAPIILIRRREAFDDSAFLFELKYDGLRALADTVNGRMLSKNVTLNGSATASCMGPCGEPEDPTLTKTFAFSRTFSINENI